MSLVVDVKRIIEDSGSPLLGKHPTWMRVLLSWVATIDNGFAFDSLRFSNADGVPLIRIRDVGQHRTTRFYNGPYDRRYIVRPGDLLVGMDGEFRAARWAGPEALLNQRVCRVRVDERFYVPRFLDLLLPGYLLAIHDETSSQTVKHLSSKSLAQIPLPLPPLVEQRRIVAVIDALLARVGVARERMARVRLILARLRQAALGAVFSGRLTEQWRLAHPNGRPRVQDAAPEALEAVQQLPDSPDEWALATIGAIAERIQYGTSVRAHKSQSGIPILRMGNIQEGRLDLTDLKYVSTTERNHAFLVREGDLLFNRTNSPELVGKAAVVNGVGRMLFASYLIRVSLDPEVALPDYVCAWINSPWGRDWARMARTDGVSQSNINSSKLAAMLIPLPSLDEQAEAVRQLRTIFDAADAIERRVIASARRVERLVQAVLAKAFSGTLVSTEAELAQVEGRSYENASALLETIARTRATNTANEPIQAHSRRRSRSQSRRRH